MHQQNLMDSTCDPHSTELRVDYSHCDYSSSSFCYIQCAPNMKFPITITPLIHTPISYLTENLVHLVRFGLVDAEPLVGPRKKYRTNPKHVCMAFASGVN